MTVSDATTDADEDRLTVLEEFGYGTSDNFIDTDGDSLSDLWELENNRDPTSANIKLVSSLNHSCVLIDRGVQCWGSNDQG